VKQTQEIALQRSADDRAAAEAHDCHAGRHAAPVGEPADQRADGGDVAQAEPAAPDHAVAEIHERELMPEDAERADEVAAAPAKRGDGADRARADVLE